MIQVGIIANDLIGLVQQRKVMLAEWPDDHVVVEIWGESGFRGSAGRWTGPQNAID